MRLCNYRSHHYFRGGGDYRNIALLCHSEIMHGVERLLRQESPYALRSIIFIPVLLPLSFVVCILSAVKLNCYWNTYTRGELRAHIGVVDEGTVKNLAVS